VNWIAYQYIYFSNGSLLRQRALRRVVVFAVIVQTPLVLNEAVRDCLHAHRWPRRQMSARFRRRGTT